MKETTEARGVDTQKSRNENPLFMGVFLVLVGVVVLAINFFPKQSDIVVFLNTWGMLIAGVYVLLFSLLGFIRKIYFIGGIIFIALWLAKIIGDSPGVNRKIMWPLLMVLFSVGILVYGLVFKKGKSGRYVAIGCIFGVFSTFVLLAVVFHINLSDCMEKIWPLFLILLGISYIQRAGYVVSKHRTERSDKAGSAQDNPDTSSENFSGNPKKHEDE